MNAVTQTCIPKQGAATPCQKGSSTACRGVDLALLDKAAESAGTALAGGQPGCGSRQLLGRALHGSARSRCVVPIRGKVLGKG